jgi:hypothetical protein
MSQHESEMRRDRRDLVAMLRAIIESNREFRESLPVDWEGDPLDDLCKQADALLARISRRGRS